MSLAQSITLFINGNNSGIGRALTAARSDMRLFGRDVKNLYGQLNGFSAVTKLAGLAGGFAALRSSLDRNLDFEAMLLEAKQLSEMTAKQAAEMRQSILDNAREALTSPTELAEAWKTLANAGLKFDSIAPTISEAARVATVFRSTVQDIANMDFDIQKKFNIDPGNLKAVHEMLYFHSKQGRFEAKSLSSLAPVYLNDMKKVGVGGVQGLNFAGALTQVMQQIAPATQPGEVATLIKNGLSHITMPHYVKGLQKFGIDVKKFMPNGRFYGEGGVQGMLDLAAEMKKKGLDNPFKMGQAGFREEYTQNFWRQMMGNNDALRSAMSDANKVYQSGGQIDADRAEIKESNFGKIKAADVEFEKLQLSDAATKTVGGVAGLAKWAVDNPGQAAAGGVGAFYLWRKWVNRKRGGAGSEADGGMGDALGGLAGGVQRVFVVNFPGDPLIGPGGGSSPMGGPGGKTGALSKIGKVAGGAFNLAGAAYTGWIAGQIINQMTDNLWADKWAGPGGNGSTVTKEQMAQHAQARKDRLEARVRELEALSTGGTRSDKLRERQGSVDSELALAQAQLAQAVDKLDKLANRPVQVLLPNGEVLASTVDNHQAQMGRRQ